MKTYKVIVDYCTKHWYHNDKLHREDGPAIEWANGDKHWYHNNKLHREDGPAIELTNGTKHWYHKGKLHREDGPAIERTNGDKEWHINGKELTEAEFSARIKPSCDGKVVEIDGKRYKLQAL